MAKVTMQLEGFGALQRALARAPESVKPHATSALQASAYSIAQRARSIVPVDTGTLRRSITHNLSRSGLSAGVGLARDDFENPHYWRFVEFGTRYRPARPFFRPAAESERETFIQRMRQIGPRLERDLAVGRNL